LIRTYYYKIFVLLFINEISNDYIDDSTLTTLDTTQLDNSTEQSWTDNTTSGANYTSKEASTKTADIVSLIIYIDKKLL